MRTIEIKVFFYIELGDSARAKALNNVRSEVGEILSEDDWEDAKAAINKLQKLANVRVDWTSNSQGFYYTRAEYLGNKDEIMFVWNYVFWNKLTDALSNVEDETLADANIKELVNNHQVDETHTFAWNVADVIMQFCNQVYHQTLDNYNDDAVEEFVINNNYEFTADGKRYIG